MADGVVYDGVRRQDGGEGGMFAGMKLWFSQGVPQRSRFIQDAVANGAQIVALEKQADVLLVDPLKNTAPGTYSFAWVERSVRNGRLEDRADYVNGIASRASRPVGSITTKPKASRAHFTDAEDQILYDWVKPFMDRGGKWKGNEIYKQIEEKYPTHTFQSWRDRWIKHTQFQNRTVSARPMDEAEDRGDRAQQTPVSDDRGPAAGQQLRQRGETPLRERVRHARGPSMALDGPRLESPRRLPTAEARSMHVTETPQPSPARTPVAEHHSHRPAAKAEKWSLEQSEARRATMARVHTPSRSGSVEPHGVPAKVHSPKFAQTIESQSTKSHTITLNLQVPVVLLRHGFLEDDVIELLNAVEQIENTEPENLEQCWHEVAHDPYRAERAAQQNGQNYTTSEWRAFYENTLLPEYHASVERARIDLGVEADTEIVLKWTKSHEVFRSRENAEHGMASPETVDQQAKDVQHREIVSELATQGLDEFRTDEQTRSCSNCFTKETDRWRTDKQGRPLCNECGKFLKRYGALRPSTAWTEMPEASEGGERVLIATDTIDPEAVWGGDEMAKQSPKKPSQLGRRSDVSDPFKAVALTKTPGRVDASVQTSPHGPSTTKRIIRQKSPEFEPESPSLGRVPQPNEAKKRSAGKSSQSTSQDSQTAPPDADVPLRSVDDGDLPSNQKAKRKHAGHENHHREFPSPIQQRSLPSSARHKRKKRLLHDDANSLYPTATPEDLFPGVFGNQEQELERDNSPTPRPIYTSQKNRVLARSSSPLLVPEDGGDGDIEVAPEPQHTSQNIPTSPLSVRLVSDQAPQVQSDPAPSHHESQEPPSEPESEALAFDVTPKLSQMWETAPESHTRNRNKDEEPTRLETQALFQQITSEVQDDFALPEPDGGWDMLEFPTPPPAPATGDDDEHSPPSPNSSISDVEEWMTRERAKYTSLKLSNLDDILVTAMQASTMDFHTATLVVAEMVQTQGRRKGQKARTEVKAPVALKGCWTEQDDRDLTSMNARVVKKVEAKHGKDAVNRRFEFLDKWLAT